MASSSSSSSSAFFFFFVFFFFSSSLEAKSLAAVAEREAQCEPLIVGSTDDEEALILIPPPPITPLPPRKRKMSQFFDETQTTPPTETPSLSTELSLGVAGPPLTFNHTKTEVGPTLNSFPMSSTTHLFDAQYDKGKGKLPQCFHSGKAAVDTTTTVPTAGAGTRVSLSTHLTLHLADPPTFKKTRRNAIGPNRSPNTVRSYFPSSSSSSTLTEPQFDEGEGNMPQIIDFFASEEKVNNAVDTTTLPVPTDDETGRVSTELTLLHFAGPPAAVVVVPALLPEDRWDIKKVLKQSDVDDSCRLLLPRADVHKHILPHVMGNGRDLDVRQEVEVGVWDMDMGSEHVLVLTKWKTGSYILKKNWISDFVARRGLDKNDEIGLRWDDVSWRLEFTVLNKKN